MRAVNLIPVESRVGGGPSAGRSGGAVYAILGGLAVLVLMVAVWAMTSGKISDQKAELARVQQEVAQVQARAGALESPGLVQQARATRTATVKALASQRTDWAERLDAISRTLPSDVTLDSLDAGGTPAAAAPAAAAAVATGPTVHLEGCAPSQRDVARLMPRLRTVPEVVDVTLVSSSTAADSSVQSAESTADACTGAKFVMDLVFEAPAPAATAPAAAGAAPAPADGAQAPATAPATATTAVPGTPDSGTTGATQ